MVGSPGWGVPDGDGADGKHRTGLVDGFTAPPKKDFYTYAGLMDKQASHFSQLDKWAGNECSNAGDLDGLLVFPISVIAPRVGSFFAEKLGQCQRGMNDVASRARRTGDAYSSTEQAIVNSINKIYPTPIPGFPDLGEIPGLQHLGTFDDTPITLTEPDPAGDITAKNIKLQLDAMGGMGKPGAPNIGGLFRYANNIFQFFTGHSLFALLITPLAGNYGRIKYLSESYSQLADATYTVSGTMRKGSVRLAGEWQGDAATAFDSLMFRWSMGSGGIGDAATVAAKAYRDAYYVICGLVQAALQAIRLLINHELKQLVQTVGGDAAIETVGGGPEDPVADVVAGIWTLYKVYRIISSIITAINAIEAIFREISAAVRKLEGDIHSVIALFNTPFPSVAQLEGDLVNQVEQRGFEFETDAGWNPTLGAARIALLPSS
jgi:uncharacterized protein YukE